MAVVAKNTGAYPVTLRDYLANGVQSPPGGVGYSLWGTRLTGAGAWIHLDARSVTLAPGKSRLVGATITVPKGAAPGQHVAGLALENTQTFGNPTGAIQIRTAYRQVIPIAVDVPGLHHSALAVGGVGLMLQGGGSEAVLTVRNSGNTLLRGKGSLEIIAGQASSGQLPFSFDTMLPSATCQIPIPMPNITLAPGSYTVHLLLNSPQLPRQIAWQGLATLRMPDASKAPHSAPRITLRGTQQSAGAAGSSQGIPAGVWAIGGAFLALVLALGAGLGVVISRRSRPGTPAAPPI